MKASLKRQKLGNTGSCFKQSAASVDASYIVALETVIQKKAHSVGEALIKPCMLKVVNLILGEASEKEKQLVSICNNTIERPVSNISADVKKLILNKVKSFSLLSFQIDESTYISSCGKLMVFVHYVYSCDFR